MPRLTRALLSALFLALVPCLRAQDTAPEPPVSVQFILFAWQTTIPELRYSPRDMTEAMPDPYGTTSVHTYVGPPTLNFYAAGAKLSPDSQPPKPVATVTFSRTATRFILVTARTGGGHYRMYAVPQDGSTLPPPCVKFHNFTDIPLAVRLGQQNVVQIDPRATAVVKPDAKASIILVAMQRDEHWRRLFSNAIELNPDGRLNVIFAPGLSRPATLYILPPGPESPKPKQPAPGQPGAAKP